MASAEEEKVILILYVVVTRRSFSLVFLTYDKLILIMTFPSWIPVAPFLFYEWRTLSLLVIPKSLQAMLFDVIIL